MPFEPRFGLMNGFCSRNISCVINPPRPLPLMMYSVFYSRLFTESFHVFGMLLKGFNSMDLIGRFRCLGGWWFGM